MNSYRIKQSKTGHNLQSALLILSNASLLCFTGWLLGGVPVAAMSLLMVLVAFVFTPRLNPRKWMRLYKGRRLSSYEAPVLQSITRKLAARAGLSAVPELYLIPSSEMGAFTMGDQENAVIGLTHELVRRLTEAEIEGVIAHEISHIRHGDIPLMTFSRTIGHFTGTLSLFGLIGLMLSFPMILMGAKPVSLIGLLILATAPQLSLLMELALSRIREFQADMGAADLTGNPAALARALQTIDRAADRRWMNWLFPYMSRPNESSLFRTHPPTRERIRRLMGIMGLEVSARHAYRPAKGSFQGPYFGLQPQPVRVRVININRPVFF